MRNNNENISPDIKMKKKVHDDRKKMYKLM